MKSSLRDSFVLSCATVCLSFCPVQSAQAQVKILTDESNPRMMSVPNAERRCAALLSFPMPNVNLQSAQHLKEGNIGFCEVKAIVPPSTDITVRLPDVWKGRYLQLGGGGMDGGVPSMTVPSSPAVASGRNLMESGFVVAASNGGHRRSEYPDASFAKDRGMLETYAEAKIYDVDQIGRGLLKEFYRKDADYKYFAGCSNGGRNASMAAADYGDRYDGIIGGDGVWGDDDDSPQGSNMAGLLAKWIDTGKMAPVVSPAKGQLIVKEQMQACDKLDGVEDGIISDPERCSFAPKSLACTGQETTACLTPLELERLNQARAPLALNGRIVGAPWGLGDPSSMNGTLALDFLEMTVASSVKLDLSKVDLAADYPAYKAFFEGTFHMSGSFQKIDRYLAKGGKLMLFHGWDDTEVPPYVSVNAYRTMTSKYPREKENVRLYMLPSVNHCRGGVGADAADLLGVMVNWVEAARTPGTSANPTVAWKRPPAGATPKPGVVGDPALQPMDKAILTRPLCNYPAVPEYKAGDPSKSSSFACVVPKARK